MFDNKEIGRKIKALRDRAGYTQEVLAEKLDFGDRTKIYRIESGKQSMTANELIQFCQLLGISLDSLINDQLISSEDYKEISKRYINNELINLEERKEVIKGMYIELVKKDFDNLEIKYMKNKMRNLNKKDLKCVNNGIEKLKIDDKLYLRGTEK